LVFENTTLISYNEVRECSNVGRTQVDTLRNFKKASLSKESQEISKPERIREFEEANSILQKYSGCWLFEELFAIVMFK
jgi:hypothetical protein